MPTEGLSARDAAVKRTFDLVVAGLGLLVTSPVIAMAWVVASISTRRSGFFRQARIGQHGVPFQVLKIRTMRTIGGSSVTSAGDARITRAGEMLRKLKIDELPQLVNVIRGDMSLVGPRPDVAGYADCLDGDDRVILTVRPGITGPATIAFRHEEDLLCWRAGP